MKQTITIEMSSEDLRQLLREELSFIAPADGFPDPHTQLSKELITIDEAAKLLQLAKPTIYGLVNRRMIPYVKMGRSLRFKTSELMSWVDSGRRGVTKSSQVQSASLLRQGRNRKS
jgi:excisionase family DNA binding protein